MDERVVQGERFGFELFDFKCSTDNRKQRLAMSKLLNMGAQNQVKDCTLRGLLDFEKATPVPIDEVEPWTNIVKRFVTGAMTYGSISYKTYTALAAEY
ncbi:hypothetical protein CONCODRAFT_3850 [Conidiobolus coronatus NRRL 28638]|uniref:Glutamate synthase domain-containing protein n=1 Tax=Conidiobolus coronatus (strain ATCC 28846 / CBS 209.66 / NRRL 28638) TaxID=796925 RepID=A0A137PDV5_CONC2|nr:hypothetical protein CONCODRAFT_3850 [Conidiobolus coronatus NRRL 28638]|eukprot:KXN73186.1 hypothetical protein CONCODRAFT_3850 [Conidiobolus coronatus NRRL 28638]